MKIWYSPFGFQSGPLNLFVTAFDQVRGYPGSESDRETDLSYPKMSTGLSESTAGKNNFDEPVNG